MKTEQFRINKNSDFPGVYIIVNMDNQKVYIGSTRNIHKRLKTHLYSLNDSGNHTAPDGADQEEKMIKYDLVKRTAEFNRQNRKEIKEGCTALDPDPEYIKTFDDLEEAKKELAKRKTSVSKFENHNMTFYSVEEYVIEENEFEFDEDENEFVQTGFIDTLETTPMKIEVVETPSYETIGVYSSLEEAEEAANEYDGDGESYIML